MKKRWTTKRRRKPNMVPNPDRAQKTEGKYTVAFRNGHRLYILRKDGLKERVEEIGKERRANTDPSRDQEFIDRLHAVASEHPGPATVIGIMTDDPKVVLDPMTLVPIPGAEALPGDMLLSENEVILAHRAQQVAARAN